MMHFRRYTQSVPHRGAAAEAKPGAERAPRYAIYYAPAPSSPWWHFGSAWLGRDAITGAAVAPPAIPGLAPEDIARCTAGPRRYGWHATLKAPFRLAAAYGPEDLYRESAQAATALPGGDFGALTVMEIGGFVALCPRESTRVIDAVACECTRRFDHLRAPSTAEEITRRARAGLTPRQQRILERWGYPYSMEEYRFHMTLTDCLEATERMKVIAALRPYLDALAEPRMRLDALCIFRQAAPDAPFTLMRRYGFEGTVEVYHDE